MAISYVGSNTHSNAGSSTTITINLPSGVAENDVVIVGVISAATTDRTFTEPTTGTWTKDPATDLYANDVLDVNAATFWKRMGATPDTSVTITCDLSTVLESLIVAYRGVDTTTALDATTTTATGTNGGTPDPASITTATNGAEVVVFAFSSEPDALTNPPTNYGNLASNTSASGARNIMHASRNITTAGAENPGTFANVVGDGSDSWAAMTFALRPAAGGAYTLDANAAIYTYTATAAALEQDRLIGADAAAYAWTANAAALEHDWQIVADSAAYTWTAADASLDYVPAGAYEIAADSAAYLWTVNDAVLSYSGEAAPTTTPAPGGIGHKRKTRGEKDTRRRRILLPDGRLLIPANDAEYRAAVEAIIAGFGQEQPPAPKKGRKRLKGAVVPPAPIAVGAFVNVLPDGFYEALELQRRGVLNYLTVLDAWAAYLAAEDEETVIMLLATVH